MTADSTWSLNCIITFIVVDTELAKWCHFVQWYSANCQWLMSSARKQSNPNIAVPYSSKFITWHSVGNSSLDEENLHKRMPQFAVCAQYTGNIEKLMRYYRNRFHKYTSISGKASWIRPSGFSLNSFLHPQLLKSYKLKSVVPDSFLPRSGVSHSEAFLASMLGAEGRSVPRFWSEEEGEGLTVFSPQYLHTTASSTRRALWVVTALVSVKNLPTWPLQLATNYRHLPWRFCGCTHIDT